ncbi:MAG: alpha/beta hydrolase family protein [Planctomycetia bacterium]|nr:alpha/beta hydrolase family protein [Planctomycetia bacterium]
MTQPRNSRREFIAGTAAAVATTALASNAEAADAKPAVEIRYVMSPPPPKRGPHTGTLDPLIQKLKAGPEFPLSYLNGEFSDLAAWKRQARAKMFDLMHYRPEACDPRAEVVSRVDRGDYIQEEILFNTTPVFRVPATVLIPKKAKLPAPGIVALHAHGGFYMWGRETLLEQDPAHASVVELQKAYGERAIAVELARRGYVVIVIDIFFWGQRRMVLEDDPQEWKDRPHSITPEQVLGFNRRSAASEQMMGRTLFTAGTTWAGLMYWDDLRTLDYFASRPDVDAARIGCVGHSLGGLRSAHLAALDDRIKAAVACGWMCSFPHQLRAHVRSTIGHTKLIPGLYRHIDYPDLTSIAAPTPLMVISGKRDELFDFVGVQAAHDKIAACYAKAGVAERFRSVVEDRPHEFNRERQADAWNWLDRWLA